MNTIDFDTYNKLVTRVLLPHELHHKYLKKGHDYSHIIYRKTPVPYTFGLLQRETAFTKFISEPPFISYPETGCCIRTGNLLIQITDQNHCHLIYQLTITAITQQILEALKEELGIPSTDTQDFLIETDI